MGRTRRPSDEAVEQQGGAAFRRDDGVLDFASRNRAIRVAFGDGPRREWLSA